MECVLLFFSSRRRHTRYWRDWSSDVCSSDLLLTTGLQLTGPEEQRAYVERLAGHGLSGLGFGTGFGHDAVPAALVQAAERSEERRVGKECRSRGSPHHLKKNKQLQQRRL